MAPSVRVRSIVGLALLVITVVAAAPAAAGVRDDYRACAKDTFQRLRPGSDEAARSAADQYCLALGYNFGKPPFQRDPVRAAALLQRAAAQGHAGAQTALGYQHERGLGVKQNLAEAVKLNRQAAQQGQADAMFNLGRLSSLGRGVAQDAREADRWFREALKHGSVDAIVHFRKARQYEMASPARAALEQAFKAYEAKNYAEAVRLYHEAAGKGNASAEVAMGQLTRLGLGIAKDEAAAVRWYRQAAERGHAVAQAQLGLAYHLGEGVKEDWAAAHAWCRKSAAQHQALGLLCVGRQYQFGLGVQQSRQAAIRWFELAEDQGDGTAAFLARHLGQPGSCLGYLNHDERKKYAGVCSDPEKVFRSAAERTAWLNEALRTARVDSFSSGGYESGLCRGRGMGYSGGSCQGDGGRPIDPYGNQDRYGRSPW